MLKKFFPLLILILTLTLSFQYTTNAQISMVSADNFKTISLEPGEKSTTYVTFSNSHQTTMKVIIDTVDGTTTQIGTFAAKLSSEEKIFFGKWAKFEKDELILEHGQTEEVKLTIEIPKNATPGDYSGGITAAKESVNHEEEENKSQANKTVSALKARTRIAANLNIIVKGERTTNLEIGEIIQSRKIGKEYRVALPLSNNGNTSIKVNIKSFISSLYEETRDLLEHEILLFPGKNVDLEINLNELAIIGAYDVTANISYSEHSLLNNTDTPIGEISKSISIIIIPWLEIIIFLVILFSIIFVFRFKKIQLKKIINSCSKYEIKQTDTLAELAKKNNIDWKILAKINKLKPPYDINPGQKILLPKKKK